jgi:hypothetical protein
VQVPDLAGRNASHDPAFPFTHWEISFLFDAKLISDLVSSTDGLKKSRYSKMFRLSITPVTLARQREITVLMLS